MLFQLILDVLTNVSNSRPNSIRLPIIIIVIRFFTYYVPLAIGLVVFLYALSNRFGNSLELGSACLGALISIYASGFSHSSSSRLRKIFFSTAIHRLPRSNCALLPYALEKLTHSAMNPDLWAILPFSEFLQLVLFCLQLDDEQPLDTLFSAESLSSSTNRLRQLHKRLPHFQRHLCAGNRMVSSAFTTLVRHAVTNNAACTLSFPVRVDLAICCMDLKDAQLLRTILSDDIGYSPIMANKLCELHARLPPLTALSPLGRRYLPAALRDLLVKATESDYVTMPAYAVQVELVMLYLKVVGTEKRGGDVSMWLDCGSGDHMQTMAVDVRVEGCWVRDWMHCFHHLDTNTAGIDEAYAVRRVVVLYGRIKRAGCTHEDAAHLKMYEYVMQQESEHVLEN